MKKTLLFLTIVSLLFSCSSDNNNSSNNNNNIVTTINPSNITSVSFESGGNIASNNETFYIGGICWNTSPNPTTSDNKTINTITNNSFTSVTGLTLNPNTVYYLRAYVQGSSGTLYGNEISITTNAVPQPILNSNLSYGAVSDIDGNNYPTIQICSQIWMAKNLNTSKYKNGDIIPQVQDPIQWVNLTTGAWCYYKNESSNGPVYGKLYNWYAVNDNRGLAPSGWHIATQQEYISLNNCLGISLQGCKLREIGTLHWGINYDCSTNESGFTAIPAGQRLWNGQFSALASLENGNISTSAPFWAGGGGIANLPSSSINDGFQTSGTNGNLQLGYSVRCIKN